VAVRLKQAAYSRQQTGDRTKGGVAQERDRKPRGAADKTNFYNIAQGSLEELRYYAILSRDLGHLPKGAGLTCSLDEVGCMLHGLVAAIRS